VVWRDGVRVGYLRSGSYGHTLGGAVGLAMIDAGQPLDAAWIAAGRWEVEVGDRRIAAKASLQPLYDPAMARVRG
jgi:4-methylaminobutanoate oxidase (formaldehyde-forming)